MTRLRFFLGLIGVPIAAQRNVSWKSTQKPNGKCPVCGTMAEKISAKSLLEQTRANHTCWPRIQDGVALTDCRQPTGS